MFYSILNVSLKKFTVVLQNYKYFWYFNIQKRIVSFIQMSIP